MVNRDLDGIYFRVKRKHSVQWLKKMCKILGKTIKRIGDELENVGGRKEEERKEC